MIQYKIAGGLLALGVVLWVITFASTRPPAPGDGQFDDVDHLGGSPTPGD